MRKSPWKPHGVGLVNAPLLRLHIVAVQGQHSREGPQQRTGARQEVAVWLPSAGESVRKVHLDHITQGKFKETSMVLEYQPGHEKPTIRLLPQVCGSSYVMDIEPVRCLGSQPIIVISRT